LVVARLLLALLLPWLLGLAAAGAGLRLDCAAAHLSLSGLSLRLEDIALHDSSAPAAPPLLRAQELVVDLAASRLLHGELLVVDAALTGARVHLQREADGSLRLPAAWRGPGDPTPTPPPPDAPPAAAAQPWQFEPPLRADSIRVHDLQVVLEDIRGGARSTFAVDIDVEDLGHAGRPGTVAVRVHSPELCDELWLQATATMRDGGIALAWQARLRGLRPTSLPWLDAPDARPLPHVVGGDLEGALHARPSPAGGPPDAAATLRFAAQIDERPRLAVDVGIGPARADGDRWNLPFTATVQGDGLLEALRLEGGRIVVGPDATEFAATLRAESVTLQLLGPWLASRGITLPAAGLGMRAELSGTLARDSLSAAVRDLALAAAGQEWTVPRLAVQGLRTGAATLELDAIEIDGPRAIVTTTPDGAWMALGVQVTPTPDTAPAAVAPDAAAVPFAWPQFRLGRLDWRGIDLQYEDQSLGEPAALHLTAAVTGAQLELGRDAEPGHVVLSVEIPGALEELRAELQTRPTAAALAIESEWALRGVTAGSLAPWLRRAGITPQLTAGTLRALASARLHTDGPALGLDARLANLRFEDGEAVLLTVRNLEGRDLQLRPTLDLGTWACDEPYVAVQRGAGGEPTALGLQFGNAAAAASTPVRSTPEPGAAPAPPPRHGRLELRRAVVRWTDASRPQPADVSIGVDLDVSATPTGGGASAFAAALRLEPALGTLALHGTVQRSPAGGKVDLQCHAQHLRGDGLESLLPPSLGCTLADGELLGAAQLAWETADRPSLSLRAQGIALRDRGTELLAIDDIQLNLPELGAERVHVAAATVRGVRAVAASTRAGLLLPGFRIAGSVPGDPAPPAAAATAVTSRGFLLPALQLDAVDLEVERLVWRERIGNDGEPVVASLRLQLAEPWATTSDPDQTPPCRFVLTATAPPLCAAGRIEAAIAPLALAPALTAQIHVEGIDTTALPRILPSLADRLDGACTAAVLDATIRAEVDLRRRDPRRFDFAQAFGGELACEGLELRAAPDGPSLFRIDDIVVDARAIDPRTGDVLLHRLDVEAPQLRLERTEHGLELLGLRLKPGPTGAADPAPARAGTAGSTAEFAIDRLEISGLQATFADRTTTPPTLLPIHDTDLRAANLSNRAAVEARPLTFAATLRGGDLDLPGRIVSASLLTGVLGTAGDLVGAGAADREVRPLVEEIVVAGTVQIYPLPKGQIRAAVHALELPALRGLAAGSGVDISDGLFDLDLDVRMEGARGTLVRAVPKFTWLSLSEPAGGPVSTYLRLPLSLDTVLFLLENDADEHILPLRVQIPADQVRTSRITEAITEALVKQIADAVASAAFRVTGAVTGTLGLSGSRAARPAATSLEFEAGDPLPARGSLDLVVAALADDPETMLVLSHELGQGDLERAAALATPPPAIVAATLQRLEMARADLEHDRALRAAEVAALYAAGRMQTAWQRQQELTDLDDHLGSLGRAEEAALQLLAGVDERTRRRRGRAAAVELAQARLDTVRALLLDRLGPDAAARVTTRPPRGVASAALPGGGRVVAAVRRRPAP
jgi:hypothetical protein